MRSAPGDRAERLEVEIAKRVAQVGALEEQLARTRRHRGELTGWLRGAIADGALRDDYRDLALRTVERLVDDGAPGRTA